MGVMMETLFQAMAAASPALSSWAGNVLEVLLLLLMCVLKLVEMDTGLTMYEMMGIQRMEMDVVRFVQLKLVGNEAVSRLRFDGKSLNPRLYRIHLIDH
jgi:hypothetical protein